MSNYNNNRREMMDVVDVTEESRQQQQQQQQQQVDNSKNCINNNTIGSFSPPQERITCFYPYNNDYKNCLLKENIGGGGVVASSFVGGNKHQTDIIKQQQQQQTTTMKTTNFRSNNNRVRFSSSNTETDDINVTVYNVCNLIDYCNDDNVNISTDLYYTPEEIHTFQNQCKQLIISYIRICPYYEGYLNLLFDCEDLNTNVDLTPEIIYTIKKEIAGSDVRGLETRLSKLIRKHRKYSIQYILTLQYTIKKETLGMQVYQRQRMLELGLRTASLQVSNKANLLAQRIAHGDRIQVDEENL